ncbi:ribonuclease P protein component [candidate division WOR-3 bacterium]|nr:ribonuclease P protein component [candidate division WOR-3 bacterium]
MNSCVFAELKKKKEIEDLLAEGKKTWGAYLGIVHRPAPQNAFCVGIKKGVKTAVERNKLRRRLKEALKKKISDVRICCEFIVIARKEAACLNFKELETELFSTMKKAGLT